MKRWGPVDIVVFVLALTLFLVIIIPTVRSFITKVPINEHAIEWVSKIMIAVISVITLYVGSKLKGDDPPDDDDKKGG